MSTTTIRKKLVHAAISKAWVSIDYNIHKGFHKQYEFIKQTILADNSLTNDEKTYAIKDLNKIYDSNKVRLNEGEKRICENCNQECLATLYCEHCVRNYLKANFSNWTSGNDIDNVIQKCQEKIFSPHLIAEWIPYNNFKDIKYLTKGGCSEIYMAIWIDGFYIEWDNKEKQLNRSGSCTVVLKKLANVESANRSWLEEVYKLKCINFDNYYKVIV